MKIVLLFPPHWEPMMPHLALPSLTAYLRAHGVEVIQRDLNAQLFDQLLSGRHLRTVWRQLGRAHRCVERQSPNVRQQQANMRAIEWAHTEGQQIAAEVDQKETHVTFVRSEMDLLAYARFVGQNPITTRYSRRKRPCTI